MISAFIMDLINFFVRPEAGKIFDTRESSLNLLTEEERIGILWWDIYMQHTLQGVILLMGITAIVWIVSKIRLNAAERKKVLAERNLVEKQVNQIRKEKIPDLRPQSDTSELANIEDQQSTPSKLAVTEDSQTDTSQIAKTEDSKICPSESAELEHPNK